MNKERKSISSTIIEISSKNNVTKEIIMLVHKIDFVNGNGLDFKLEYTEKFKDTLLNKPVVTQYYPLKDDLGDHEAIFDSEGNIIGLETIAIGTIKEVWIDDFETDSGTTVKALFAKADLWNYKYPEIIACVEKLFNSDNADSSVEVEIYAYGENPTYQYRYATDYCYIGNCLLGSTVIPADSDAGIISIAQKEIARAAMKDLQNLKNEQSNVLEGGEKMDKKELFNKGNKIKYHIEKSELSLDDIKDKIYNFLNPIDPETEERKYRYWIRELFQTYVIIEDWNETDKLYKVSYTVEDEKVTIAPESEWIQVELTYQPINTDLDLLVSEKEKEINELQDKLNKSKEDLELMSEQNKEKTQELESKVAELQAKIDELNALLVSEKESKVELEEKIKELNSQIEELKPYKENFEKVEKEKKVQELSSKYSKLLSEETFKSERVQNAINELNTVELNNIVVEEVAKQKTEVETASKKKDDVTIVASKKDEDLIPKSLLQKYGIES
ncbi:hypothetical protein [Bacillus smithii]|uniref:hypothetical protein n=1 Tax=Bacillus smithii TaxID=1479 RepID=UPI003D1F7B10